MIVNFTVLWANPCKLINSKYKKLSEEFKNVTFAYCEVENVEDNEIKKWVDDIICFPSFKIYDKSMTEIEELKGNDEKKLKEILKIYNNCKIAILMVIDIILRLGKKVIILD